METRTQGAHAPFTGMPPAAGAAGAGGGADTHAAVLIADDHPVYRDALSQRLRQDFDGAVAVSSASTFEEACETVSSSHRRWVVLLDLLMPGLEDVDSLRQLRELPNVDHVVALSGLDSATWEPKVLTAGASLFISKCNTSEFICTKLRQLMQHERRSPAESASDYRLTVRQQQVLELIGEGWPNKIIADRLQITEQTVKLHVKQIFKELRVYNRTQAVLKAQKLQML